MKCNYCGTEYEGTSCPECNAKAESETTVSSIQNQAEQNNYQQSSLTEPIKSAKKKKPFYLRWWFIAIVVLAIGGVALLIGQCVKNSGKYEIPYVFGLDYKEATEILEAEGFEVKTVAATVDVISEKLNNPLENVKKGTVFKIDDYMYDNDGDLTFKYEYIPDQEMTSNDKKIVIYYAKETYIADADTSEDDYTYDDDLDDEDTYDEDFDDEDDDTQTEESDNGKIRSDFKTAMDSYEKFFNEYAAIMKKYAKNPGDTSILADYSKYVGKYSQMMSDFEKWESKDMNNAELAYYLEVQGRITQKLLEVSQ